MLAQFLPGEIFGFLFVFARVGAIVMAAPALGEVSVPPRVRLSIALAIAAALWPVLSSSLPAMPASPFGLLVAIGGEVLIGLFIGGVARLMMSSLHVGGAVIAFQSGLAVSMTFDPSQGTQSAIVSSFLSLLGVVVIFSADLHLMIIAAMRDSYALFPPSGFGFIGDLSELAVRVVAGAFLLGVQISAPFLVYGLVFYTGLGLIARLMPQLQVFFIAMPLNIYLGFFILLLVLSATMMWFAAYFEAGLAAFLK